MNFRFFARQRVSGRFGLRIATSVFMLFAMLASGALANPTEATLGFGVAAGRSCGSGFSVRKMPMEGFGWQAGGIYLKSSSLTYFNLGTETFYILNRTKNTCLYVAVGLSYSYDKSKAEIWMGDDNPNRPIYESELNISKGLAGGGGVGVAFRYKDWDQIWFSADLLLTAYHDTVLPAPQVAIHYFFK